ncbi:MAG: RnfH family protein [Comamonadaceae bacterium]|nr:RnfH family protein [Comamonadaceae bacterium]
MLHITVAYASAPRQVQQVQLQLPDGATLAQAVQASALLNALDAPARAQLAFGLWSRQAPPDTPLHDQDRVEIWRPLQVDPKLARRERFNAQGARTAGLFATRRPGSKPGY